MSNVRVSVDASPEASEKARKAIGSAATAAVDAARDRRRTLVEKAKQEATAARNGAAPEADASEAETPRERVDSIEVELPNGRHVEFGPPPNVSMTVRLLAFFGTRDPSRGEGMATTLAMCVRSIDGRAVQVVEPIGRDKLINEIGDDGMEVLEHYYTRFWPRPTVMDLKLIKKNYR